MKRAIIILLASVLLAFQAQAGYRYSGDGFEIRLTEAPCTVQAANDMVKPQFADQHRQGWMRRPSGKVVQLCWLAFPDHIEMVDEDGLAASGPLHVFKEDFGV